MLMENKTLKYSDVMEVKVFLNIVAFSTMYISLSYNILSELFI